MSESCPAEVDEDSFVRDVRVFVQGCVNSTVVVFVAPGDFGLSSWTKYSEFAAAKYDVEGGNF